MKKFLVRFNLILWLLVMLLNSADAAKLSTYTSATSLNNADYFPIVQSGVNKNVNWENIDRLKDASLSVFNVKKYGATGDGTTEDTTAIQNALNAANVSGGTVFFPAGTYLTADLTIYKNVSIKGVNKVSSVLKAKAATTNILTYSDTTTSDPNTNSTYFLGNIENLKVDCNSTGANGISITRAPIGQIDNVGVYNCATGIKLNGSWISKITNSHIRFNQIGFSADEVVLSPSGSKHDPNFIIINNTIFRENTSWAIVWNRGSHLYCNGCDVERNGTSGDTSTGAIKVTEVNGPAAGKIGLVFDNGWFESNWGSADVFIGTPYSNGISAIIKNTYFYTSVPSGTKVVYNIDAANSGNVIHLSNSYLETPSGTAHINTAGVAWFDNNTFTTTPLTGGGRSQSALYSRVNQDTTGSGSVGIGTTNPYFPFDLGSANASTRATLSAPSTQGLLINSATSTSLGVINTTTGSSTQGGSIILGSFDGALRADGDRLGAINGGGSTASNTGGFSPRIQMFADGGWTAATSYPSKITFDTVPSGSTTRTERMVIRATGNVGIGSTNPAALLDVNGAIRSSSGTAGQASCWKADKTLGQCTSVVGAGGDCTCS